MPDDRYYPVTGYEDGDGTTRFYEKEGEAKKTYAINQRHLFKLPRVFSIFCQGTGGHRYGHCKELITEFHSAYWDRGATQDGGEASNEYYTKHYYNSFLILDGPGRSDHKTTAGPDGVDLGQMGPPHPMPGDFWPCSYEKIMKPSKTSPDQNFNRRVSEMSAIMVAGKHRGDIYGDGWNDNVAHTLFVLNELLKKDQFPDVINLVGWSRGAVTTIKVANAVYNYFVKGQQFQVPPGYDQADSEKLVPYPNLEQRFASVNASSLNLNIFAIDPVPGRFGLWANWGGSDEIEERFPDTPGELDYQSLPPIVKKCVITLAMDERRSSFAPLSAGKVASGGDTKVVWLPFPGIHRTQLRMEPRDPTDENIRRLLKSVPHLVFDLAWKFMTSNGTRFKKNLLEEQKFGGGPLSLAQIVELYSDVWLNRANYHETRNVEKVMNYRWRRFTGYQGLGTRKKKYLGRGTNKYTVPADKLFTRAMRAYVDFPGFFINMHHQACFEKSYPALYRFLTTANDGLAYSETGESMLDIEEADLLAELSTIFPGGPEESTALRRALAELGFQRTGADAPIQVILSTPGIPRYFEPGPDLAAPGKRLASASTEEEAAPPPTGEGPYNFEPAGDEAEAAGANVPTTEFRFDTELIRALGLLDYPQEEAEPTEGGESDGGTAAGEPAVGGEAGAVGGGGQEEEAEAEADNGAGVGVR